MRILRVTAGLAAAAVALAALGVALAGQDRRQAERRERRDPGALLGLMAPGGQIGVSVREVDAADVEREKLPGTAGAVIEEVVGDSPAARAGLRAGDVVVEFDGERVRSARQFARLVHETPPGRAVPLGVIRGGERLRVEVTPERGSRMAVHLPAEPFEHIHRAMRWEMPVIDLPEFDIEVRARTGRLGVSVHELSPQLAEYFGVKSGVLVTSVADDSPAARAGLRAGDVITAVDGQPVDDAGDLRRRVAGIEDDQTVDIEVVREKKPLKLSARVEGRPRARR